MNWQLHRTVFELRYPVTFAMWDCSGELAESLREAVPALEISEGNPSKVELRSKQSALSLSFQPSTFVIRSSIHPKIKDGFASECDILANLILKKFKIKTLDRIGNRTQFTKTFSDTDAASKALQNFALKSGLALENFSVSADSLKTKLPKEFSIKFEDEKGGITLNLRTTTIKTELDPQFKELFPKASAEALYHVEADFDIYTSVSVDVETCSPRDFIQSNIKMLETLFLPKLSIS